MNCQKFRKIKSSSKTNVLFATDIPFWKREMGNHQRIWSLTRFLKSIECKVSVAYVGLIVEDDLLTLKQNFDFDLLPYHTARPRRSLPIRMWRKLKFSAQKFFSYYNLTSMARNKPRIINQKKTKHADKWFEKLFLEIKPQTIIVEYIHLTYLITNLQKFNKSTLFCIDTHDVMSDRHRTFCDNQKGHLDWISISIEEEKNLLSKYDVIFAIQKSDAKRFRSLLPHKQVIKVGHAPDMIGISSDIVESTPPIKFLFVGGNGPANVDTMIFLIENVWVRLPDDVSYKVELHVVGGVCDSLRKIILDQNVYLHGRIEDLAPIYNQTSVVINPVRIGGGLKIKNVEALYQGKILITSSVGAVGFGEGVKTGAIFVCDRPSEIIEAITRIIKKPGMLTKQSSRVREYSAARFTPEFAYRELLNLLLERKII